MKQKSIVMLGTDWTSLGGMTAVVRNYRDGGLWERWPIRYLATFKHDNMTDKIRMAARAYLLLLWWLLSGEVAAVHAHSAVYASIWRKFGLLWLARLFGVKTVFHLHGGEFVHFYEHSGGAARWLVRYLLRMVDAVVVLTDKWVEILQAVEPACEPIVLANPIALPNSPATPVPGRVLFLGRLRDVKGVFDLIEALPPVVRAYPRLKVVFGGDGDPAPLLALAESLGVREHIELAGWIDGDAKAQQLREAEVFVLPSHFEAQPVCILEAMAQGVPVLATAVGGVPDMCADGKEALIVPPHRPEALSEALVMLLGDAALRQRLVTAARARVERQYVHAVVFERLDALYAGLGLQSLRGGMR
ncbi:glycosyltransferase family 4 protein [Jeongeupia chitinilytica]|uniref:Glycosyltransferase family 1 protein n=1 Tax=Jeongeupia chitinilytica TaxID=1041641 RepID=A0ABQ3GW56_9NEIS|nr:glycosyltransferase family 4 protein [Jeongeupia chitinilytica]GHD56395.1 hypothetical protein GCM10007350_03420 [Jeongeupia chitinilytica]